MTHRCTVHRNTNITIDEYGMPDVPLFSGHIASLACYAWATREREVVDGDKTVRVADWRMVVPKGTDINEADELVSIQDRLGVAISSNKFSVESVIRRFGHLELVLEEVA